MAWQGVSQFQTQTGDSNNNIASSPNSTSLTPVLVTVSLVYCERFIALFGCIAVIFLLKLLSNSIDQLQLPLNVSGPLLSGLRDKMKPLPPITIPKRNGLLWFLPAWEIDWDFHCGAVGKWWMLDPLSSLNCLSAWIGWRAGCLKFFLLPPHATRKQSPFKPPCCVFSTAHRFTIIILRRKIIACCSLHINQVEQEGLCGCLYFTGMDWTGLVST